VVGFSTLVFLGVRWYRGEPLGPYASPAFGSSGAPVSISLPGLGQKPFSIALPGQNQSPETQLTAADAEKRDRSGEVMVAINSSRYVKSIDALLDPQAPVGAGPIPKGKPSLGQVENDGLPDVLSRDATSAAVREAWHQSLPPHDMLVVCNVSVELNGEGEISVGEDAFRLVSQNKEVVRSVPCSFAARQLQPLSATPLRGGKTTGDVVFPVRRGVQPQEIQYAKP
jgi:hypothetical protein